MGINRCLHVTGHLLKLPWHHGELLLRSPSLCTKVVMNCHKGISNNSFRVFQPRLVICSMFQESGQGTWLDL